MSDKLIGLLLIIGSLGILGAVIALTIIVPLLTADIIIGYWTIAVIISLAVLIAMLLSTWIGWTLLTTKAPEAVLGEDDADLDTTEEELETPDEEN